MTGFQQTFFGKLYAKLVEFFDDTEKYLESLIEPVLPEIKDLGKDLRDKLTVAALTAVKDAAANGGSGKALIDAAFDAIKEILKSEGKELHSTGISLLATIITSHAQVDAHSAVNADDPAEGTPLQKASKAENADFNA